MDDRLRGERWSRVETLYHAVMDVPVAARAEFLRSACADDTALRREVEALLSVAESAESFLEQPPSPPAGSTGTISHSWIGQRVGPYDVTALIGAGGMGEVYRATDTRLGRNVALKVLHDAFNADADRLRRFEQESRATAVLNHPNILAVFDVGAHDGAPYYVAELLEGETLRDVLRRGPLTTHQAIDYALQMANGLEAAHERGIIHRDLKPENVFVTTDGRVKVLDFGVAKLVESTPLPRLPGAATLHGTLVGTVGYMSPEQLRGEPVDARSDIFSFGALLHEMITGHRAFESETAVDTISTAKSDQASRALAIAHRCLEKASRARFASCRDVIAALSDVRAREHAHAGTAWRAPVIVAALVVMALSAALVAWIALRQRTPAGAGQIQSVAVLPLASLSRDPDDEVFADGMTGALITNLAKIRALRVVSRTSVMPYKNTQKSVPQIGRELNVDAVVEGSIERVGNRVRISTQLIHAATDQHVWAEAYDRDARDVLLLQNEVAQSVAREVRVTLTPEERARFGNARAVDPEAYELYLKARVAWNERTEGSIKRALAYLTQAIERDPNYAAAYSGIADCYLSLGFSFDVGSVPPHDAIPKAKSAALKALTLDDSLGEAHSSLAYAQLNYDWDWRGAEAEFKRALTLNPGSAEAHHWYSHLLVSGGRMDESLAESDRALALDRLNPIINVHLGWNQFFARQYDSALVQLGKAIELDPNYGLAYWYRGLAYEQQGRFTDALTEMRKAAALLTGNVVVSADIGHVYGAAGDRRAAEHVIADLQRESARRYVSPFEIALIYVGIGDTRRAFEWLDKAYRDRSDLLVYLKVDPRLDPIRSDVRFKELVTKVGVP
jgi:serine/threonine protein kinase/tetratricopeptide (TPR) repeat protein